MTENMEKDLDQNSGGFKRRSFGSEPANSPSKPWNISLRTTPASEKNDIFDELRFNSLNRPASHEPTRSFMIKVPDTRARTDISLTTSHTLVRSPRQSLSDVDVTNLCSPTEKERDINFDRPYSRTIGSPVIQEHVENPPVLSVEGERGRSRKRHGGGNEENAITTHNTLSPEKIMASAEVRDQVEGRHKRMPHRWHLVENIPIAQNSNTEEQPPNEELRLGRTLKNQSNESKDRDRGKGKAVKRSSDSSSDTDQSLKRQKTSPGAEGFETLTSSPCQKLRIISEIEDLALDGDSLKDAILVPLKYDVLDNVGSSSEFLQNACDIAPPSPEKEWGKQERRGVFTELRKPGKLSGVARFRRQMKRKRLAGLTKKRTVEQLNELHKSRKEIKGEIKDEFEQKNRGSYTGQASNNQERPCCIFDGNNPTQATTSDGTDKEDYLNLVMKSLEIPDYSRSYNTSLTVGMATNISAKATDAITPAEENFQSFDGRNSPSGCDEQDLPSLCNSEEEESSIEVPSSPRNASQLAPDAGSTGEHPRSSGHITGPERPFNDYILRSTLHPEENTGAGELHAVPRSFPDLTVSGEHDGPSEPSDEPPHTPLLTPAQIARPSVVQPQPFNPFYRPQHPGNPVFRPVQLTGPSIGPPQPGNTFFRPPRPSNHASSYFPDWNWYMIHARAYNRPATVIERAAAQDPIEQKSQRDIEDIVSASNGPQNGPVERGTRNSRPGVDRTMFGAMHRRKRRNSAENQTRLDSARDRPQLTAPLQDDGDILVTIHQLDTNPSRSGDFVSTHLSVDGASRDELARDQEHEGRVGQASEELIDQEARQGSVVERQPEANFIEDEIEAAPASEENPNPGQDQSMAERLNAAIQTDGYDDWIAARHEEGVERRMEGHCSRYGGLSERRSRLQGLEYVQGGMELERGENLIHQENTPDRRDTQHVERASELERNKGSDIVNSQEARNSNASRAGDRAGSNDYSCSCTLCIHKCQVMMTTRLPSPPPGLDVWVDGVSSRKTLEMLGFLPDDNKMSIAKDGSEAAISRPRFPKDDVVNYLLETSPKSMHVCLNGEKRSSQVEDKSEDYGIVREIAGASERYWVFDIEDIHCPICLKIARDQRRRDADKSTRLHSRAKGIWRHEHCMNSSCHQTCDHERRPHHVFSRLGLEATYKIKYVQLTSSSFCVDPDVLASAITVLKPFLKDLEGLELNLGATATTPFMRSNARRNIPRQEARRFVCCFWELEEGFLREGRRLKVRGLEDFGELEGMWWGVRRRWWG